MKAHIMLLLTTFFFTNSVYSHNDLIVKVPMVTGVALVGLSLGIMKKTDSVNAPVPYCNSCYTRFLVDLIDDKALLSNNSNRAIVLGLIKRNCLRFGGACFLMGQLLITGGFIARVCLKQPKAF